MCVRSWHEGSQFEQRARLGDEYWDTGIVEHHQVSGGDIYSSHLCSPVVV